MITCYLRYEVALDKLADFETYGAMWLELVPRFGGSYAEFITVPAMCLARKPRALSHVEAAGVPRLLAERGLA